MRNCRKMLTAGVVVVDLEVGCIQLEVAEVADLAREALVEAKTADEAKVVEAASSPTQVFL
jgi:hypothetical protein